MPRTRSAPKKPKTGMPTFLQQWREYRDLTQEQLAEKSGVSTGLISQYESGQTWFGAPNLVRLASTLNCTPAEILAVDPSRDDGAWPLFRAINALDPPERQQILAMLRAYLGTDRQ